MSLTRRSLLRASALATGALVLTRPLGILGQPLENDDVHGTSRVSRLFPGQRLAHADMHNHTLFSDGDGEASAAYESMKGAGLDIAALTDHSTLAWAPGIALPDPCTLDPTGECSGLWGLDEEEWQATLAMVDAATVTAADAAADPSLREFLAVRGFEWSSPTLGHMNVWFSDTWIDPLHTGGLSAATTAADFIHEETSADPTGLSVILEELLRVVGGVQGPLGMLGFQQWLAAPADTPITGGGADGLAGFNHPGREAGRFGEFAHDPALQDQVISLELLNRKEDYLFELTDINRPSPLIACLGKGWRPGILGVTDEHGTDWGNPTGKGRGGFWVGELSPTGMREAMRQRRFFATRVKGLRVDAAANGVRMGQAFRHEGGQVLLQLDIDAGAARAGRELSVHVLAPPSDGSVLPAILHDERITLPAEVVEFTVDVDPLRHPWIALRISEPGVTDDTDDLQFGGDGRATGTPYEPLGRAWAYTSPWYLDADAAPPPAAGRAPLTIPTDPDPDPTPTPTPTTGPGNGGGGGTGGGGTGGGGTPTTPPTEPTEPPTDPAEEPVVNPVVHRRAGAGRIETAVELSRVTFTAGTDTVLVADGGSFPDALSGAAAAAMLGSPILLVSTDAVPEATAEELRRLEPRRILVLGGTNVVSPDVEAALGGMAEEVQRLAGPDRWGTSAAISTALFGTADVVWVASGQEFPDALAGGAAAARDGAPLLLVARDTVPAPVEAELRRLAPSRIVLLGGTASVTEAVAQALGAIAPTTRIAGQTRFDTAVLASQAVVTSATHVLIASGGDFADALAAAPVAARRSGPVLLVSRDRVPDVVTAELERLRPEVITIAGGTAAVSPAVQDALEALVINEG